MIKLSIVIPTHNRREQLQRTLQSIAELVPDLSEIETVVVANACADDTEACVEEIGRTFPTPLRLIRENRANLNIARNVGAMYSKGEIVALIDDDVKLDVAWARALLDTYVQTGADMVQGRVDLWFDAVSRPGWMNDGISGFLSRTFHGNADKPLVDAGNVVGANFSFRKSLWERLGGFREGLDRSGKLLTGGGDVEFARRGLAAGSSLYYSNGAALLHWVAPERVTPAYLVKVAYGNGMSQVFIKVRMGPVAGLRCIIGHVWLVLRGTATRLYGYLSGNATHGISGRLLAAVGRGGLQGVWKRLTGKAMAS